jgi:paraquat-inducible protein B
LIGAFVLGAVALLMVGLAVWSGGFGEQRNRFVMYFEESVKGLEVGAPVLLRGVQIGSVVDIQLIIDPRDTSRVVIPVVAETERTRFQPEGDAEEIQAALQPFIDEGLRAQLDLQSFVTGRLLVQLAYQPDKPAVFRGEGVGIDLAEIPTVPAPLKELENTLEGIDIVAIAERVQSAVESLDRLLSAPETLGSLRALNASLRNIEELSANLDRRTARLSDELQTTLAEARGLLGDGRMALGELRGLGERANATVERVDRAVAHVEALTHEDSPTVHQLDSTLRELTAAARAVQELADTIERRPESLLFGKD